MGDAWGRRGWGGGEVPLLRGAPGAARSEAPRSVNPSGTAARCSGSCALLGTQQREWRMRPSSHRLCFILPKQSRLIKHVYVYLSLLALSWTCYTPLTVTLYISQLWAKESTFCIRLPEYHCASPVAQIPPGAVSNINRKAVFFLPLRIKTLNPYSSTSQCIKPFAKTVTNMWSASCHYSSVPPWVCCFCWCCHSNRRSLHKAVSHFITSEQTMEAQDRYKKLLLPERSSSHPAHTNSLFSPGLTE